MVLVCITLEKHLKIEKIDHFFLQDLNPVLSLKICLGLLSNIHFLLAFIEGKITIKVCFDTTYL